MSKFTFICEDEPMPFADAIITKKTFEFNADHLNSVVGEFVTFLRGCGFHFDGQLIIYNESPDTNEVFVKDDLDDLDSIFSPNKSVIK
jgi:hypothetical protein